MRGRAGLVDLAELVRIEFRRACEIDGISAETAMAQFSAGKPEVAELDRAMRLFRQKRAGYLKRSRRAA
jgi:hypothetical protein